MSNNTPDSSLPQNRHPNPWTPEVEKEYLRFQSWLQKQKEKKKAKDEAAEDDDLIAVRRAKFEFFRTHNKRLWYVDEVVKIVALLESSEDYVNKLEEEEASWKATFHHRLKAALNNTLEKLSEFQARFAAVQISQDSEEAQLIIRDIRHLSGKIELLSKINLEDQHTGIRHITQSTEEEKANRELDYLTGVYAKSHAARSCANCGRSKVGKYPLCRSCTRLYEEGKISGDWTKVGDYLNAAQDSSKNSEESESLKESESDILNEDTMFDEEEMPK